MSLLLISFIAGILTGLAPCVLPLLPLIVGSSLVAEDRLRPYTIVASLAASLVVFTILLKATTVFLNVPPTVWQWISGVIIITIGIATVWPHWYERFSSMIGFYGSSQKTLGKYATSNGVAAAILTGVALGPVFSSCSPTYALILATVLPVSFAAGIVYLLVYILGLSLMLLAVILLGRKLTKRLGWALNPEGWFKRALGIIFILIGLAIITGFDKRVESAVESLSFVNISNLEKPLLPSRNDGQMADTGSATNGKPHFAITTPIQAPEITGITDWINSSGETLAGLKGKVVLIDFWTYSCINCIHTLPHVTGWYDKYKDQGLVVLGIHAPEFSFEHVRSNVAKAVQDDHINYPVGLDNNFATWRAYSNQYWPAEYFIDREGNLRHYQFGEGEYANDELVIQALLSEGGMKVTSAVSGSNSVAADPRLSPETYLGYSRAERNINTSLVHDAYATYPNLTPSTPNSWSFGGSWSVGSFDTTAGANAALQFRFSAKQVYLVMGASTPASVQVKVNGTLVTATGIAGADVGSNGSALVGANRLYKLVNSQTFLKDALLELTFDQGAVVNAFTFDP